MNLPPIFSWHYTRSGYIFIHVGPNLIVAYGLHPVIKETQGRRHSAIWFFGCWKILWQSFCWWIVFQKLTRKTRYQHHICLYILISLLVIAYHNKDNYKSYLLRLLSSKIRIQRRLRQRSLLGWLLYKRQDK